MSKSCPLLFRKIDATTSKISTAAVITGIAIYFVTLNPLILVFLIIDFILRLSSYKSYSPIFFLSSYSQKILHIPTHMIDAGGKRLAAFFGLAFTVFILIAHLLSMYNAGVILAVLFAACAIPDILFEYCIACKIYSFSKKIFPKAFI